MNVTLVNILTGALGTAIIGGIAALIGAALQNRREHRRWLRQQRLAACDAYLGQFSQMQFMSSAGEYGTVSLADGRALQNTASTVMLLGPESVRNAAADYNQAAQAWIASDQQDTDDEKMNAATNQFITVVRRAIGIDS